MISVSDLKSLCGPRWDEAVSKNPVARIWQRDHTLWKPEPKEISNRLGWLDLPDSMPDKVGELKTFAKEARARGFQNAVLLGMGGSSLCAEVLRLSFSTQRDALRLTVLDTTISDTISRLTSKLDLNRTLFLVSSKSGGTIEVMSLYRYFRTQVKSGQNFIAITDPGTGLERMAGEENFWRAFINPSDIGGRYSALSLFGLVPAALLGIDISELLSRARQGGNLCRAESPVEENPGAWLGLLAGCLARNGRNKLTILTSPAISSFGLWAEQLIAESTGKEGKGIVPVALEPVAEPQFYSDDRLFVYLRLRSDNNTASDNHLRTLEQAGTPVIRFDLNDPLDLGSQFFIWEFAVAVAGSCLRINPFDQPNVEESKKNTMEILNSPSPAEPQKDEGNFTELINSATAESYLAIMAFTDPSAELEDAFAQLRSQIVRKKKIATTLGYGPRFLHSTGQLHKGGPAGGLFLQITSDPAQDLEVPGGGGGAGGGGRGYSFGRLAAAQADGDLQSLRLHNRKVGRIHCPKGVNPALRIRALSDKLS